MITQDEHTARHSPAGACVFPAGSDGVGGLLIRRRYGTHVRIVHPRESGGISNREVGVSTA